MHNIAIIVISWGQVMIKRLKTDQSQAYLNPSTQTWKNKTTTVRALHGFDWQ